MANKINIVISADDKASEPIRRVKGAVEETAGGASKFNKALSAVAKTSLVVAGAGAAVASKFILWDGAMRALNIEDAQSKLKGLGHDAKGVQGIMDSALASVKGTAYGLGDAATLAATAVAAGVKPGKELTKYLRSTADAATIAGVSITDMGRVFNKVETVQAAYNDSLLELSEKGIPIYQWLQDELGVTATDVKKLASEGKISSEQFRAVIEKNIGGAALESGKTTRGAFENMKAAMARVGAEIAEDILPDVRNALGGITSWFDDNSSKITGAAKNVFGSIKLLITGDFKKGLFADGISKDSGLVDFLFKVRDGAIQTADAVGGFLGPKMQGLWKTIKDDLAPSLYTLWKEVLEPLVPVVGVALVGALGLATDTLRIFLEIMSPVISFLADNQWIIWGVVGAFAAFKTAMIIDAGVKKFQAGIEAMKGVGGLSGLMTKFDDANGKIGLKMIMPAIAVGAALAALQMVIDKHLETKAVIEETTAAWEGSKRSGEATDKAMATAVKNGKISQESYQTYLKNTSRIAGEESAKVKNQYSGAFGWINKQLDKLSGSPAYKRYEQETSKGGGSGWSSGGYTGAGGKYEVAGPVHRGEFVVKKEDVDQSTGLPKGGAFGGGHTVYIQNMNINNGRDEDRLLSDIGFALETAS